MTVSGRSPYKQHMLYVVPLIHSLCPCTNLEATIVGFSLLTI